MRRYIYMTERINKRKKISGATTHGAIWHIAKALAISLEMIQATTTLHHLVKNPVGPCGQQGMDAIIDPQPFPAHRQQTALAHHRQVAGYFWLRHIEGVAKFADT